MKNKRAVYLICCVVIVFSIYILPSFSFFNSSALGPENVFSTGEWHSASSTVQLEHLEQNYSNQESITSYVDEVGDHFQIEIELNKPQFLSFLYKLQSEETAELFDRPAVMVAIGETILLQIAPSAYDDQWHASIIDLSNFDLNSGIHNLIFIPQNTYDDLNPPNFQVKEVTTTKLFATNHDRLQFTTTKPVKSLFVSHKVFRNDQEETIQLTLEQKENNDSFSYLLPQDFAGEELLFWSEDFFGNIETTQLLQIYYNHVLGASQCSAQVFLESDQEFSTQIKYFNENEIPKFFKSKISQNPIISEEDWNQAMKLPEKKFHEFFKNEVPIQAKNGEIHNNLVFDNQASNQLYLTIKLCNVLDICDFCIQNHSL